MFMGEFNHTIDPKNRVIIPSKFREGLGEKIVLTAGLDGCLYMLPYSDFVEFVKKLNELPFTKKTRELQRFFTLNASEIEVDKQGRALIPANLKNLAGIDKDIVFVGVIGKIELWAKEKLDQVKPDASMEDIAETLAEEYGLRF